MQGDSWETAHCLGHLARERVIKQTNPTDKPLCCEQSRVGKFSGGNITYAWSVLSAPSRWNTYNYYRKEKARCYWLLWTNKATPVFPCRMWAQDPHWHSCVLFSLLLRHNWIPSLQIFLFFPNGKLSDTGLFETERAVLGRTGKNPGMDFFSDIVL